MTTELGVQGRNVEEGESIALSVQSAPISSCRNEIQELTVPNPDIEVHEHWAVTVCTQNPPWGRQKVISPFYIIRVLQQATSILSIH